MEKILLLILAICGWSWAACSYRALRRCRRALQLAEQKHRDAEQIGVSRSQFISYLAHETRTLAFALQGGIQLVRNGSSKHSTAELFGLIDAMATELNALLSLALDRAHIDSGKLVPTFEHIDLQALVKQVMDEFSPLAETRKLYLSAPTSQASVHARTDAVRLRQVIRNLVANALKFTRIGGVTVYVRSDQRDGLLAIQILDTGVGLTAEQCAELFSEHAQPHVAPGQSNTGLGLCISRAVARALGGDLTLESSPGRGSTFTVWVPKSGRPGTPPYSSV